MPQDVTAPVAPSGLTILAGDHTVSLDWNNNTEPDLAGYNVFRSTTSGGPYTQINGSLLVSSAYTDNTALNFITYYYVIRAVDNTPNANTSANSAQVSAIPQDVTPPAAPGGLSATAGNAIVNLDWSDNTEPDLAGYNVYRATVSGGPYTQINGSLLTNSTYADSALANGTPYYYVVRAIDNTPNANISSNSIQVSATPVNPNPHTVVETFEGFSSGSAVMFRNPAYSASTTGIGASNSAVTTTEDRNPRLDPAAGTIGTSCDRINWNWSTAGTGFIRLTTSNMSNRPNPAINLTKGLSLYIKLPAGQLDLQLLIRETGGSGPIGSNGGSTGVIEKTTTAVRVSGSGSWQYVYFDLPNLGYTAYTGNGVINGAWGSLEALAISAVAGDPTTNFALYVDDVYQGPQHTPIPTEVILDNSSASFTGTWSVGTTASGKFGTDYRFATSGASSTVGTYNFNLYAPGQYTVQVFYPAGTNRANNAPHVVTHASGTTIYNVNQQINSGVWVTLGTHAFAAGGGLVQIQAAGANPSVIMADAVKLVYVGP